MNQQMYPQVSQQEEGLGFPIARITVLLSLPRLLNLSGSVTGDINIPEHIFAMAGRAYPVELYSASSRSV